MVLRDHVVDKVSDARRAAGSGFRPGGSGGKYDRLRIAVRTRRAAEMFRQQRGEQGAQQGGFRHPFSLLCIELPEAFIGQ